MMELDELLAIMAASIYAGNKARERLDSLLTLEKEEILMKNAFEEANQLYKIVLRSIIENIG